MGFRRRNGPGASLLVGVDGRARKAERSLRSHTNKHLNLDSICYSTTQTHVNDTLSQNEKGLLRSHARVSLLSRVDSCNHERDLRLEKVSTSQLVKLTASRHIKSDFRAGRFPSEYVQYNLRDLERIRMSYTSMSPQDQYAICSTMHFRGHFLHSWRDWRKEIMLSSSM